MQVKELPDKLLAAFFEEFGVDSIATADGKTEGFEALARVALEYVEARRDEDRAERLRLKEEIRMIREGEEPK